MKKKSVGLLILSLVYIFAVAIGIGSYIGFTSLGLNDYLAVLIADVLATIFVWLMGVIFKTASMYDPYWSVQTLVIYLALLIKYNNWNIGTISLLMLIALYSIRLTANFIIGFDSLSYVDWRYKMLKSKSGKLYQLVNLFGICMFPTLVVYACTLPTIVYAKVGTFSYLSILGLAVLLIGIVLELIPDIQMKKFIKIRESKKDVINIGLWKYSRHPNYLGEILIWFGVALAVLATLYQYWYFIFGAIINLLMFIFISIPMEERHMKEYKDKDQYEAYIKNTSPLLILPKRENKVRHMIGVYVYIAIIVDIIFMMIFIPKWLENRKDDEYHMDVKTIDRYNNVLSYINKETSDISLPASNEIISISFDNHHLDIMTDTATYIDITMDVEDINEAVTSFNEDKAIGSYLVVVKKETINTTLENNCGLSTVKSLVTNDEVNSYVSYTAYTNDGYVSKTHLQYDEQGNYPKNYILETECKEAYDFCYYIMNKATI